MAALQISPKIESLYELGTDRPQNYKGLHEILQLLQALVWTIFR